MQGGGSGSPPLLSKQQEWNASRLHAAWSPGRGSAGSPWQKECVQKWSSAPIRRRVAAFRTRAETRSETRKANSGPKNWPREGGEEWRDRSSGAGGAQRRRNQGNRRNDQQSTGYIRYNDECFNCGRRKRPLCAGLSIQSKEIRQPPGTLTAQSLPQHSVYTSIRHPESASIRFCLKPQSSDSLVSWTSLRKCGNRSLRSPSPYEVVGSTYFWMQGRTDHSLQVIFATEEREPLLNKWKLVHCYCALVHAYQQIANPTKRTANMPTKATDRSIRVS